MADEEIKQEETQPVQTPAAAGEPVAAAPGGDAVVPAPVDAEPAQNAAPNDRGGGAGGCRPGRRCRGPRAG